MTKKALIIVILCKYQKRRGEMEINKKRFVFYRIGKGKKAHIFPKNHLDKAICLRGPAGKESLPDDEICKECVKEYLAVVKSSVFAMFVG